METITVHVEISRPGNSSREKFQTEAYVAPGLVPEEIAEVMLEKFEDFDDEEIINGIIVGGIFIDLETGEYRVLEVGTDAILEEIAAEREVDPDNLELTSEEIDKWLWNESLRLPKAHWEYVHSVLTEQQKAEEDREYADLARCEHDNP